MRLIRSSVERRPDRAVSAWSRPLHNLSSNDTLHVPNDDKNRPDPLDQPELPRGAR